jgi:alpha-amylase
MISETPYIFSRVYESEGFSDRVVAGLDLKPGKKRIDLNGLFEEGTILRDYYSGEKVAVKEDQVTLDTPHDMVLLGL